MSRPPARYPTELELTILKLFWRDGALTSLQVRDLLADEEGRDIAPTSAITTLNTMVDKGYLSRQRDGRAYIYTAEVEADTVSRGILRDVVDRVFDGSASSLMLHLINDRKLSAKELSELESLVKRLSDKRDSNKRKGGA